MTQRLPAPCLLIMFSALCATPAASQDVPRPSPGGIHWSFDQKVANLQVAVLPLRMRGSAPASATPPVEGVAWFGSIPRRDAGTAISDESAYVPFMAEYLLGVPVRAWVDSNLDGELADESPVILNAYPGDEGARSFLVDLQWNAGPLKSAKIQWKLRVVLEPQADSEAPPSARLQRVFARMGEVVMEGRRHRAVMYDGNSDGLYTKEFGDGIFVDEDDDLHFDIDQMSPSFGPFSTAFVMGRRRYEVTDVAADGSSLTIRDLGPAAPLSPVEQGKPAPPFTITDTSGRTWRLSDHRGHAVLVYFWNSRCGTCRAQAGPLADLLAKVRGDGLEIVGISYDADRAEMEAFRREHGQDWPTSFVGKAYWENPVGRRYRADSSGLIYLVDRDGIFRGRFTDVSLLAEKIETLLDSPRTARR